MSARIAALFVETDGAYFGIPAVDPWDERRADGESTWHLHGRPGYGVWRGLCGAETFSLVTVSAGVPVLENDAMVCPQCEATHIP